MFDLCLYSFVLFCMNFACIFVSAYFMFYIKKVDALPLRSTRWREISDQIKEQGNAKRLSSMGATAFFDPDLKEPLQSAFVNEDRALGRHTMQEFSAHTIT